MCCKYFLPKLYNNPSSTTRYILLSIGYFLKWFKAPHSKMSQNNVIYFIEDHIVWKFGFSQTLTTDRGTIFTGKNSLTMLNLGTSNC